MYNHNNAQLLLLTMASLPGLHCGSMTIDGSCSRLATLQGGGLCGAAMGTKVFSQVQAPDGKLLSGGQRGENAYVSASTQLDGSPDWVWERPEAHANVIVLGRGGLVFIAGGIHQRSVNGTKGVVRDGTDPNGTQTPVIGNYTTFPPQAFIAALNIETGAFKWETMLSGAESLGITLLNSSAGDILVTGLGGGTLLAATATRLVGHNGTIRWSTNIYEAGLANTAAEPVGLRGDQKHVFVGCRSGRNALVAELRLDDGVQVNFAYLKNNAAAGPLIPHAHHFSDLDSFPVAVAIGRGSSRLSELRVWTNSRGITGLQVVHAACDVRINQFETVGCKYSEAPAQLATDAEGAAPTGTLVMLNGEDLRRVHVFYDDEGIRRLELETSIEMVCRCDGWPRGRVTRERDNSLDWCPLAFTPCSFSDGSGAPGNWTWTRCYLVAGRPRTEQITGATCVHPSQPRKISFGLDWAGQHGLQPPRQATLEGPVMGFHGTMRHIIHRLGSFAPSIYQSVHDATS